MPNGAWLVRHSSSALGAVEVSASSRDEALTKMPDRVYGAFWDMVIETDGKGVVNRLAERYI